MGSDSINFFDHAIISSYPNKRRLSYHFYLECLLEAADRYGVDIHAYVLMGNHTHILCTPQTKNSIGKSLQSVGRRYVGHYNYTYKRTGTLWEGRYKATLIDSEQYLLTCMRYIELNPVRARMVSHPTDYPWSSHSANAYGKENPLIKSHELYRRLGRTTPKLKGRPRKEPIEK